MGSGSGLTGLVNTDDAAFLSLAHQLNDVNVSKLVDQDHIKLTTSVRRPRLQGQGAHGSGGWVGRAEGGAVRWEQGAVGRRAKR